MIKCDELTATRRSDLCLDYSSLEVRVIYVCLGLNIWT